MTEVKSKIASLRFDETEATLFVDVIEGAVMDREGLENHYQVINEITEGRPHYALVDLSRAYTIDAEGLEYAADQNVIGNRQAVAYCSPTLGNRFHIMQLQIKLRSKIPHQVFPSKNHALAWLHLLKK